MFAFSCKKIKYLSVKFFIVILHFLLEFKFKYHNYVNRTHQNKEYERSLNYNDQELNIDWKIEGFSILSDKDAVFLKNIIEH